jgi:hypothetical protein
MIGALLICASTRETPVAQAIRAETNNHRRRK